MTPRDGGGTEAKFATSMWQRLRDQLRVGPRHPTREPGRDARVWLIQRRRMRVRHRSVGQRSLIAMISFNSVINYLTNPSYVDGNVKIIAHNTTIFDIV